MSINKDAFIVGICDIIDEKLLENRITTEGNAVALFLQDLTMYDDVNLTPEDFITKDGRFLFCLGKTLRESGYSYLDEVTVFSKCSSEITDKISAMGGYRTIQHLIDVVSSKNVDAILDDLTKSNVLIKLYKSGFNLFKEMTLDNGKKVTPIKLFEKFNSTEVMDWYEAQISGLSCVNNSKITGDEYLSFDDNFFEQLKEKKTMGASYADAGLDINGEKISTFPFLNNSTMGFGTGLHALVGYVGNGKTTMALEMIMSLVANGRKFIIVENECPLNDLKVIFLEFILYRYFGYAKLSRRKLRSGGFTEEDMEMLKKAGKYWEDNYKKSIRMVSLMDADAPLTCQIIKNAILREGYNGFLVDTFKLDTGDTKDNFWISLISDSKKLNSIALKYEVVGLITVQLALNTAGRLWIDESCLSTAKGLSEILETCIGMRRVQPEELIQGSPIYCAPFRSKQNEKGEWFEEPYEADPSKVWRMWFIIKNRKGMSSNDNGVTYLVRYDGDHCSFYETAKARSSRKNVNNQNF